MTVRFVVDDELAYELREITLSEALDVAEARWRSQVGWIFEGRTITFEQMRHGADLVAKALHAAGIRKGDVVAIWAPNQPEFAFVLFACAKVGAVLCALNTRAKSFEAQHQLSHSGARLLLTLDHFLKNDFVKTLEQVCGVPLGPRGVVDSTRLPALRSIVALPGAAPNDRLQGWEDFVSVGRDVSAVDLERVAAEQRWSDPVLLQYTSGTTARPKGALCNHRYVLHFGVAFLAHVGLRPDDILLNTQPVYHVGGACGAIPVPLSTGCKVVSPLYYEPAKVLALIARHRCTVRSGTAAMYSMEMDHPNFTRFDLSSLRAVWCNGSRALMERIRVSMGARQVVQVYAATEGGGACGRADDPLDIQLETCGRPVAGVEIRIVDPEGKVLVDGSSGEIQLRGWWQMNGYYRQPDETAKVISPEGWLRTGDLGCLTRSGELVYRGRIKDMIRVGGENVSAEEVEAMLMTHPAVVQVAVIGAPDARLSEVVFAIVQAKAGVLLDATELVNFCAQRMANFRVPKRIEFVGEWPLTSSGKIMKTALRERFLA